MIINDLDGYYIVFDTKNWNTELDTLFFKALLAPLSALFPLISFNQLDGFMLILSNQLDKKRINLSDTDNGIMK